MQNVFIVGSKGIPGAYGGFETFVDKLTEYHQNCPELFYHVACKGTENKEYSHNGARCFQIKVPNIGPAQAICYDVAALRRSIRYIKKNRIPEPIVYVLACRIGPFAGHFRRQIRKLGGKFYVNPDGHEWLRAKWPAPVRKYWKLSEKQMVRQADLLICDSRNIESYIQETYRAYTPKTAYIAYGAETRKSALSDDSEKLRQWYEQHGLAKKSYYLIVGRFVPENNYETILREFMRSHTDRTLAVITNTGDKFYAQLKEKTGFDRDQRIRFVGTVYDKELLMKIRENAYGYLHGHEVGGTNPSLLEALGSTDLNLLLDVGFNRECGQDGALYWSKQPGDLAALIDRADAMNETEIRELAQLSTQRIRTDYSWEFIAGQYKKVFTENQ